MVKDFKFLHQTPWFEIFVLFSNSALFYLGQAKGGEFLKLNDHYFILSVLAMSVRYGIFFLCFLTVNLIKYKMEKLKHNNKEKLPKKNNEIRRIKSETEIGQKLNQL